jgi:hypothetical protein
VWSSASAATLALSAVTVTPLPVAAADGLLAIAAGAPPQANTAIPMRNGTTAERILDLMVQFPPLVG